MTKYEEPICEECRYCTPIGEGDHECDVRIPKIVVEEYIPSNGYGWCDGRYFIRR